ncbi:plasmid recombination protein, partial [Clostridium botulinum]
MSFAIIRNVKYKMPNLQSISRHNERQNKNYGNKDIDIEKSDLNYHLRKPIENSYEKEFYRLREENNLKGNLRLTGKKQSNVAC